MLSPILWSAFWGWWMHDAQIFLHKLLFPIKWGYVYCFWWFPALEEHGWSNSQTYQFWNISHHSNCCFVNCMNLPVEHLCLAGILYTSFVLYGLRTRMHIYRTIIYTRHAQEISLSFPWIRYSGQSGTWPIMAVPRQSPITLGGIAVTLQSWTWDGLWDGMPKNNKLVSQKSRPVKRTRTRKGRPVTKEPASFANRSCSS